MSIEAFLTEKRALVEQALGRLLPPEEKPPSSVHRAMRYTLMLPGKRLRALVLLASGGMLRAPEERLVPAACQVEMVHAASLILDDLPCMDGATLRRGVPANHLVFGEATAILAAFA
ncbi:MAG: polyprenyl synthetase, partial [Acidobacteria bacterium]